MDLAIQSVQEPIINGLSSLSILAEQLFKDVQSTKTVNAREILAHMMDNIALFGHANWKLNMKRWELIKPDLNPPYKRLCKEEKKTLNKAVWRRFIQTPKRNVRRKTYRTTNAESDQQFSLYQ